MYLNILQFIYNKLFVDEFKSARFKEFKFRPLSQQEVLDIFRKSSTVFDMQHNMQNGLTMRTIETLGAKRKLITTNGNITKYDFYNENNILVLNEHSISEIDKFIRRDYEPINDRIYEKYSLNRWIEVITSEKQQWSDHN
jgi:hypothetical protein